LDKAGKLLDFLEDTKIGKIECQANTFHTHSADPIKIKGVCKFLKF